MEQLYYLLAAAAIIVGALASWIKSKEKSLEDQSKARAAKLEEALNLREEKINMQIEMLIRLQTEHGNNCINGLNDIKDTLKEIKIQINNHTATNTALSIEVERIKTSMDNVTGRVDQMERMNEAMISKVTEILKK